MYFGLGSELITQLVGENISFNKNIHLYFNRKVDDKSLPPILIIGNLKIEVYEQ